MPTVEARCTQCGSKDFGGESDNNNSYKYDVDSDDLRHGSGSTYGTEELPCPACSDECQLDECKPEDPCERCVEYTIHNRCGQSVPTAQT